MLFKSPRGTKDILPQESIQWQELEDKARDVFALFAYGEIRTPVFEESKLFTRSLGELTDIVSKQMFLIKRDADTFCLRPEATASIIRSYIEQTLYNVHRVSKFFYIGPMFRAERPQKGRLRQFHHIGCEAIGSYNPFLDSETIFLADYLLKEIGISDYEIILNTLGCLNDKKKFSQTLKERLRQRKKSFCQDCQSRMNKNVFRILDCKNRQCQELIRSMNLGDTHCCDDCQSHFQDVKEALALFGVKYKVDPLLVRGLDYYTRTVFEIIHPHLGAKDALGAGGRYDNLVEELGGPRRGAVGFALGVERMLLAKQTASSREDGDSPFLDCYLIPLGDAAVKSSLGLSKELRDASVRTDIDYLEGSLKSKLRRADKSKARFCLIIGEDELRKGVGILKDMVEGTQKEVGFSQVLDKIKEGLC